jgi:hypothetical protein
LHCHPEALLLREGSPGIFQSGLPLRGSLAHAVQFSAAMGERLYSIYIVASRSGLLLEPAGSSCNSTVRRQRAAPAPIKSSLSREILRAKQALQDDSIFKLDTSSTGCPAFDFVLPVMNRQRGCHDNRDQDL